MTKPKQCQRLVKEEGNPLPAQCKSRVHKAGLCIEHWQGYKMAKVKRVLEPQEPPKHCSAYKCFKVPVINADGVSWCMKHFNREMTRRMKLQDKQTTQTELDTNA